MGFYAERFHLVSDQALGIGGTKASPKVRMLWETADANANVLLFAGPSGGAVDVPVYVFGDDTALNADLGFFNGITEPTLAVLDSSAARYLRIGWDGTYFRFDTGNSGHQFFFNKVVNIAGSLVMGNNSAFQIGTGAGEMFFISNGTNPRIYGGTNPVYIGSTGTHNKLSASGNDLYIAGELEVDGTAFFDGTVQFGTLSGLAGEALSGYITINDAAGNARKLAVIS